MMSAMAYLYTLNDPKTDEVRYVGWTLQKPNDRLSRHLRDAIKLNRNYYSARWIRSLIASGTGPIMHIVARLEAGDAPGTEIRYIAALRAAGARLVNTTDGGAGSLGCFPNEETRARLSKAKLGKPHSPEHRAHLAAALSNNRPAAKLTRKQVDEIRIRRILGEKGVVLAREFMVSHANISMIYHGKTWRPEVT